MAANVRAALELVEAAADRGARLIALPETWAFKGRREGIVATAEAPDGPSNRALAAVAARRGVWVLAGSVYEPAPGGLVSNVSALFDPAGDLRAVYRKIHLFDVTVGGGALRGVRGGGARRRVVTADVDTADGTPVRLGLSICYDLRFPELYRSLTLRGAPGPLRPVRLHRASPARRTGRCCCARGPSRTAASSSPRTRWATHRPGRDCFGHSMIVDPWGTVLARSRAASACASPTWTSPRLDEVRGRSSLEHRRPDVYDR